jgi:ABC-type multidrug transport system ATPase subunit
MIQRLGIAVATLPDAPVLILDEPTISLDPEGTIRFREYLAGLKREGKTVVFSSHVLFDVECLADRVAILIEGKLAAVESVEALRNGVANGSRLRLLLANPDERYARIARGAGASEATLANDTLILSSRAEDRCSILRAVEDAGAVIRRFSTEEPSLEEIYRRYIDESAPSVPACGGGLPDPSATAG